MPTGFNITLNSDSITVYVAPVNTISTQGIRANFSDYTSGSKLSIGGTLTDVGDYSDYMVFQLSTISTGTGGSKSETLYYSFDELWFIMINEEKTFKQFKYYV